MSTENTKEEFDFNQMSDEMREQLGLHELKPGVTIPMGQPMTEAEMKKAMLKGVADSVPKKAKVTGFILLIIILAALINGAIDLFNLIF